MCVCVGVFYPGQNGKTYLSPRFTRLPSNPPVFAWQKSIRFRRWFELKSAKYPWNPH